MYMSFGEEGGAGDGDTGDSSDGGSGDTGDSSDGGSGGDKGDAGSGEQDYKIPEEYKDKPWAKGIKSEADLYKQHEGVQELIGKKSLPPEFDKMTEVQREEHYSTTRPEKAEDYKLPDNLEPDLVERMKEIFHKKGISQFRAFELAEEFQKYNDEIKEGAFSKEAWADILKDSFGSGFETKAPEIAKIIGANLTDIDKKILEQAPNPVLGLIYRLTNNYQQTHGATENGMGAGKAGQSKAVDMDKTRTDLRNDITALASRPHSWAEKDTLIKKLNDTYK